MNQKAPVGMESSDDYLAAYRRAPVIGFDEAIDQNGHVRPHWQTLLSLLHAQTPVELKRRSEHLHRRVRETGIDFDIFAHPTQPAQNWRLDLAPVLISPKEWRWLEQALTQRARLMDAILRDIYGEQRLMREGLIPPELVFADPTFLRPCVGVLPQSGPLRFLPPILRVITTASGASSTIIPKRWPASALRLPTASYILMSQATGFGAAMPFGSHNSFRTYKTR